MRWSRFFILAILTMTLSSCGSSSKEVYPFSKAKKIEVISYTSGRESWDGPDYSQYISGGKIAFSDSKIKERAELNESQKNDLYEFLFEDDCPFYASVSKCYDPRHIVLFYDKEGNIFDYFEACLECGGSEAGFEHNEVCIQRTGNLIEIFAEAGIKHFGE